MTIKQGDLSGMLPSFFPANSPASAVNDLSVYSSNVASQDERFRICRLVA